MQIQSLLKLFEPTFMIAGSFHALIEKGIRKKNKLQDFSDLVDIVNERRRRWNASNKPKLENVQVVHFNCDSTKLYWKESFSEKEFH